MVCTIEYIWLGSKNEIRSKTKVINKKSITLADLPNWNYDGSSTGQAIGKDSEVLIIPRNLFIDPFSTNGYIVMCDTFNPINNKPHDDNKRFNANEIFQKDVSAKPWFGLEQEYFLIDPNTNKPLGFPNNGNPNPQGQYYCSVGAKNSFGRDIANKHLDACIKAGIQVSGMNAEVAPGQWEFQVGPVEGIDAGDHLWVARYLLLRIAESHNVIVDFEPKPVSGDWNGSGCHCNFSTVDMRDGTDTMTGLEHIELAIERLSKKHDEHMAVYGTGNELRMTGEHETSRYDQFSSGRANRGASVRIGNETVNEKKGYFEDRRPSSNCDPYLVTSILFNTSQFE